MNNELNVTLMRGFESTTTREIVDNPLKPTIKKLSQENRLPVIHSYLSKGISTILFKILSGTNIDLYDASDKVASKVVEAMACTKNCTLAEFTKTDGISVFSAIANNELYKVAVQASCVTQIDYANALNTSRETIITLISEAINLYY